MSGGFNNMLHFVGVVEDNHDRTNAGRVRVRAFGIHPPRVSSDIEELGIYKEHQTVIINKNKWHQACNYTNKPCHILEVQHGEYCTESDIERYPR